MHGLFHAVKATKKNTQKNLFKKSLHDTHGKKNPGVEDEHRASFSFFERKRF